MENNLPLITFRIIMAALCLFMWIISLWGPWPTPLIFWGGLPLAVTLLWAAKIGRS